MSAPSVEEESIDAAEASVVTESPEEKPSKGGKTKKNVPSKPGDLKANRKTNGTAAVTNMKSKGQKDSPSGPKKAKVAKMDGETAKGEKAKKPAVKTAAKLSRPRPRKRTGAH